MPQLNVPYAPNADAGSWDWLNEAHCAYVEGQYDKALVAAVLFHAESVESLRLILLEGAKAVDVAPMSDSQVGGGK
jgi:hypothetical protein